MQTQKHILLFSKFEMNIHLPNYFCNIFLMIFIFINLGNEAMAIEESSNSNMLEIHHVEWVKNWPSSENKKKNIKDYLNSIVLGMKHSKLNKPVSVFANNLNEFWVLDQGGNIVLKVNNNVGDIPHQLIKANINLSSVVGICSDKKSKIFFTDSQTNKIYWFSSDNKKLLLFNDTLKLEQPTGIAYFPERKEIWVVETKAHRITVLNEKGELVKRIGSRGDAHGEFNYPTHIWIDKGGVIYITDAMNFRVQVLSSDGYVISVFGEAGDASGYFARPKGIATDSYGNIYIVYALFNVVQVFNKDGVFLYSFGSQGRDNQQFWMPSGIFIDQENYIYVADTYNSRIQIFQLK